MTHTPAEWAEVISASVGGYAALSAVYFLLVDADLADFDPRPAVRRAIESGRLDPLLVAVAPVWVAVRDAALDTAALFILLTTSPKGAMA